MGNDTTHFGNPQIVSIPKQRHTTNLATIHNQLKRIFADVRQRAAFKNPTDQGAFDKNMTSGIDGIGRSHAILAGS